MNLRPSILLIALTAWPALPLSAQKIDQATNQNTALHFDAGLAFSLDHHWKAERDNSGSAGVVTKFPLALEGALVFPVGQGAIRAALRYAVDQPFQNFQIGADWIHIFSRIGSEMAYGSLGLTINNVTGRFEVQAPSYVIDSSGQTQSVQGLYDQRSQSARPGIRLGGGYAFSKHFAFEGAVNFISLASTGDNGFLHSSTVYLTLTGSYRLPNVFGGK